MDHVRGVLLAGPWVLYLLATDVVLSLLLPISFFVPTAAYNVASQLAYVVWAWIQVIFTTFNHAKITISGDHLPRGESAIVIANHVAWTDFYMIQELASRAGMLARCRWFAKAQLKWVPFLGWGLWAMGMPLISRNWDKDQKELERVFRGPRHYRWPMWLISYSEATRFTPKKYEQSVQWCNANKKPTPEFALYPRTKGFVTTMKALRKDSSMRAVYDLTIAYAHKGKFFVAPDIWTTMSHPNLSPAWSFHVHVERITIEEFDGKSDEELALWLEQQWMLKSKRLRQLKEQIESGRPWDERSGVLEVLPKSSNGSSRARQEEDNSTVLVSV